MSIRKRVAVLYSASLLVSAFAAGSAWAQLPPGGWAPEGSPVAAHGKLKVSGSKLQSASGTNVQLKGMSLGWSSNQDYAQKFFNERVVAWLANDWRCSVVRAPMGISTQDDNEGRPYQVDKTGNKARIEKVVKGAIEQGIYVIIDWHSHRAHLEQSDAVAFFGEMAEKYKDYPNVMYEIYNEPLSISWDQVKTYANAVISAIRKHSDGIIMVGTPNWCQDVSAPGSSPISGTNIMYTVHFYCDHNFQSALKSAAASQPFFASEFGYSHSSGNGSCNNSNPDTWITDLNSVGVSWVNWALNNKDETASALKFFRQGSADDLRLAEGNWGESDLTNSGSWIREKLRGNKSFGSSANNPKYKVAITPVGQGTIAGTGEYSIFANVSLTANPGSGQRFEGWIINGEIAGNANPLAFNENYTEKSGEAVFFKDNLLKNSTFTAGVTSWTTAQGVGVTASGAHVPDELVYKVSVTQAGASNRNGRLQQTGVSLTQGRKYRLSFRAKAASSRSVTAVVCSNASGTVLAGDTTPVQLSSQWQEFSKEYDMTAASATAGAVEFRCGAAAGDWFIDDIALEDIGAATTTSARVPVYAANAPFKAAFNGRALTLSGAAGKRAEVTVFDMAGRVRLSSAVSLNGANVVSLDRLPAGVYSVRYKVDGQAAGSNEKVMLSR